MCLKPTLNYLHFFCFVLSHFVFEMVSLCSLTPWIQIRWLLLPSAEVTPMPRPLSLESSYVQHYLHFAFNAKANVP